MLQPKFSILWSMSFILSIGCASRPLASPDDFEEFNKTSRECKNAYIYFRDSTYSEASSLDTDGHMIYWIDHEDKTNQEELLRHVEKVVFTDRETTAAIGAFAGALGACLLAQKGFKNMSNDGFAFAANLIEVMFFIGIGGNVGGAIGHNTGVSITYILNEEH